MDRIYCRTYPTVDSVARAAALGGLVARGAQAFLQKVAAHEAPVSADADAPPAVALGAVSYTHLDVYKRQGLYERVRKAFWFCVKLCFCVLVVVSAAAIALAPQIISLFLAGDPQVQEIGTLALRLQCALIPLFAFTCLANMMLQTMGIAGRATLLARCV